MPPMPPTPTLKIALVNMPFAGAHLPSIALTQLRSVVQPDPGDREQVRLFYARIPAAFGILSGS